MKAIRSLVSATAMAAFSALSPAQTAGQPPALSASQMKAHITMYADAIEKGTNAYCKPEYDGDKSKGELTNADIGPLVRSMASLPDRNPDADLKIIHDVLARAAAEDHTVCVDNRNTGLTPDNLSEGSRPLLGSNTLFSVLYPRATTLTVSPKSVDAKNPDAALTGLLGSFIMLARRSDQFGQAVDAMNKAHAAGDGMGTLRANVMANLLAAPQITLYDPAKPFQIFSVPSEGTESLVANPVIRLHGEVPGHGAPQPSQQPPAPPAPLLRETREPLTARNRAALPFS